MLSSSFLLYLGNEVPHYAYSVKALKEYCEDINVTKYNLVKLLYLMLATIA